MKLMSKKIACSWQGLASEEIWITLVEIFCNLLVWMGQCDSSVLAILLALTPLLPQLRFEKQIKHLQLNSVCFANFCGFSVFSSDFCQGCACSFSESDLLSICVAISRCKLIIYKECEAVQ